MTEQKAFLGLFQFYSWYIPNIADKLGLLYRLLRKDVTWRWETNHSLAFQQAKESLQTNHVLVHYDPKKELILTCDASQYGMGAVLSHIIPNGCEKLVAYASRTLSAPEKNYSQLDKEGQGLIFGVKNSTSTYLDGLSGSLLITSLSSVFSAREGLSSIACHQESSGGPCL